MATTFTQVSRETREDRGESHNKSESTIKTDVTSMLSSRDEVQQDLIYETAMSPLRVWLKVRRRNPNRTLTKSQ